MAMFLSRLKQILNFQSKTVTATTSQQVVTPDQGYDGLEQVTVNPQVHTQTYIPADNTAANDMGVNNNYRYVNTSGMHTPSSIMPSNVYPEVLYSGNAVIPLNDGYAIRMYTSVTPDYRPFGVHTDDMVRLGGDGFIIDDFDDVTPSSTPIHVDAYDIVRLRDSGVIVDSIPPTPTSITPSNSSPVALTANTPVNPTGNGYAIESYHSITPRNYISDNMTAGEVYIPTHKGVAVESVTVLTPSNSNPPFLGGASYQFADIGYAISSYSNKTPNDNNPPSISSGEIVKAGASGYLYATQQSSDKIKTGTVTLSTSATTYVNIGFKPKYIGLIVYKDNTHFNISIYNENISDSYTYRGAENTSSNMNCAAFALPTTSTTTNATKILSIDSTGFTIDKTTTTFGTMAKYFAIGEEPTGTLPPMNVTVHHGSSSVSNYAVVDNIGYTKLKLVSSTATTSAGNQYAIDNGSFTSVSVGSTVSIPSTGQVKLYLNRTGENTAVWEFSN